MFRCPTQATAAWVSAYLLHALLGIIVPMVPSMLGSIPVRQGRSMPTQACRQKLTVSLARPECIVLHQASPLPLASAQRATSAVSVPQPVCQRTTAQVISVPWECIVRWAQNKVRCVHLEHIPIAQDSVQNLSVRGVMADKSALALACRNPLVPVLLAISADTLRRQAPLLTLPLEVNAPLVMNVQVVQPIQCSAGMVLTATRPKQSAVPAVLPAITVSMLAVSLSYVQLAGTVHFLLVQCGRLAPPVRSAALQAFRQEISAPSAPVEVIALRLTHLPPLDCVALVTSVDLAPTRLHLVTTLLVMPICVQLAIIVPVGLQSRKPALLVHSTTFLVPSLSQIVCLVWPAPIVQVLGRQAQLACAMPAITADLVLCQHHLPIQPFLVVHVLLEHTAMKAFLSQKTAKLVHTHQLVGREFAPNAQPGISVLVIHPPSWVSNVPLVISAPLERALLLLIHVQSERSTTLQGLRASRNVLRVHLVNTAPAVDWLCQLACVMLASIVEVARPQQGQDHSPMSLLL